MRGGFLEYISLQEDGLPIVYNGFLEELEMRRDLTYGEMEVTRGGPSGVLTSNGAAAIVNFLSRKATDTPEGEVAVSYYTYGEVRTDLFYGGPIGNSGDTTGTIGTCGRPGEATKTNACSNGQCVSGGGSDDGQCQLAPSDNLSGVASTSSGTFSRSASINDFSRCCLAISM